MERHLATLASELSRKDVFDERPQIMDGVWDYRPWSSFFSFLGKGGGAVGTAIITAMAWRGRIRGARDGTDKTWLGIFWLRVRSIMAGPCSFMYYNIQTHSGIFFLLTLVVLCISCLGCLLWLGVWWRPNGVGAADGIKTVLLCLELFNNAEAYMDDMLS